MNIEDRGRSRSGDQNGRRTGEIGRGEGERWSERGQRGARGGHREDRRDSGAGGGGDWEAQRTHCDCRVIAVISE